MTTINEYIAKRSFGLNHDLDDDIDVIDNFMNNYDSGYICDIIQEVADNQIPIYTHDIWKNAYNIQEYIEEAIGEGLAPTDSRDIDLVKIFQAGYYVYYTQVLYNNLEDMMFNMIADKVNEFLSENEEYVEGLDLDETLTSIEEILENLDNNNRMEDIFKQSDLLIGIIKDGEYN